MSTYYYKPDRQENDDENVKRKIRKYCKKLPESGYRSVCDHLRMQGIKINKKRVQRLMREEGLQCRKKRKYKAQTTESGHKLRKYPNLLKETEGPNPPRALVGDVTAFDIRGRDHYLATLMRLENREIVGFAVSDKNNTDLVKSALAVANKTMGSLKGYLHHTDSDVRYCSGKYVDLMKKSEMKISMCCGNVYENAHAESLNGTIKRQEINVNEYESKEDAARSIAKFVRNYNTIRPHSALNGLSPIECIKRNFSQTSR